MFRMKKHRSRGAGSLLGQVIAALFGGGRTRQAAQSGRSTATDADDWPAGFHQEVVGESNYQDQLRAVGGKGQVRLIIRAELVPESSNQYDPNAVRVDIKGAVVGYLPRADAKRYRKWHGTQRMKCQAFLVGSQGKNIGAWVDVRL